MLDRCCVIKTHCDAILHNGTYTHRQNAEARQPFAASAGADTDPEIAIMMGAITQSLKTIVEFDKLLRTVAQCTEEYSYPSILRRKNYLV
jgi:hypothetical protein